MMCGITGTPGTGKSVVADELARRGHRVVHLVDTIQDYIIGVDETRDTQIVDIERWAAEFRKIDGFVEGHFAHLLPCDRIVILRCRPDQLKQRLSLRKYRPPKISENVEAEALDVCLVETVEMYDPLCIIELDTTDRDPSYCAEIIEQFVAGKVPAGFGSIDWSSYLEAGA